MKLRNSLEGLIIVKRRKKIILPSMSILFYVCVFFLLLLLSIFFKSFIIHRTVDLTKKWTDNTKKSEASKFSPSRTYLY